MLFCDSRMLPMIVEADHIFIAIQLSFKLILMIESRAQPRAFLMIAND
ncbi:hypothetical protein OA2633_07569 [Oceanicaulis sp. HTCC2633]|nr:hypothetical protein OA2633_07569 [Oceanicaulis sp. HTCC2633]